MAFTRRWTRREDRLLRRAYYGIHSAAILARQLHRSRDAVIDRWKRLRRVRRLNLEDRLPAGVSLRDPRGTFCLTCATERAFTTAEGRLFATCRCGTSPVPVVRP